MEFLSAFLIGGAICALGQVIIDKTSLTQAHGMVLFVVAGAALAGLGLYEPLVKIGGAGAMVPVSNFGFVMTQGVVDHLRREGLFGLLSGVLEVAGAGLVAALLFGFLAAVAFRPRG